MQELLDSDLNKTWSFIEVINDEYDDILNKNYPSFIDDEQEEEKEYISPLDHGIKKLNDYEVINYSCMSCNITDNSCKFFNDRICNDCNKGYFKHISNIQYKEWKQLNKPISNIKLVDYFIDINKCRKNCMYYNKYKYPQFTVLDNVKVFKPTMKLQAGKYYIETNAYFPCRGNGWYHQHMIEYLLKHNLITLDNIKFCVIASLTIEENYFNGFIDYCYDNLGKDAKLSINSLIGMFAPSQQNEKWKHEVITKELNDAFTYLLENDAHFVNKCKGDKNSFYNVFSKTDNIALETEKELYNFILEEESIMMHELNLLIEEKNGTVLSLNTDCIRCIFPDNVFPFKMLDDINIDEYFFDENHKVPKY